MDPLSPRVSPAPATGDAARGYALILANLGGPADAAAIRPFLQNLFSDPDVIAAPGCAGAFLTLARPLIARLIASRRAPAMVPKYALMNEPGGGSPQTRLARAQAEALERALAQQDPSAIWRCYLGMAYAPPFGRDAVKAAIEDGFTRLVFVPMFPHACKATTVAIEKMLRAAAKPYRALISEIHVVPEWFREPELLADAASAIEEARERAGRDARVVLVFHGVPQSFPDRFGDPYAAQTRRHTDLITRRLPGMTRNRVHVAYQSRIGPAKWLEPNVIDVVKGLGENGEKKLVIAPLSFVTDHIETLVELDVELREVADHAGIELFRASAPNARPGFVRGLAGHIQRSLRGEVTADPDEDGRDHAHIEGSGCCTD